MDKGQLSQTCNTATISELKNVDLNVLRFFCFYLEFGVKTSAICNNYKCKWSRK